jgi:hypothetical protein
MEFFPTLYFFNCQNHTFITFTFFNEFQLFSFGQSLLIIVT